MILIVMHHYVVHGQFGLNNQVLTFNKIYIEIFSLGGKLGVNCFVLVSGYFLINSKFKLKKLFDVISQVWSYSIIFLLLFIFYLDPVYALNFKILLKSIFPVIYNQWWFITVWIVMYILSPYVNLIAQKIERKDYKKLIWILLLIWCFVPTFLGGDLAYSNLGWFITVYLIGGYIKKYNYFESENKKHLIYGILWYGLIILSVLIFDLLGEKVSIFSKYARYFSGQNKLPLFMCSLELFLGFKNLKIKNYKLINLIGGSTFGVYLIHENIFMRPYLWQKIFKNKEYLNSSSLILHSLLTVMIIYVLATIIEIIRQKTLGKIVDKGYLMLENKINISGNKYQETLEKIEKYIFKYI